MGTEVLNRFASGRHRCRWLTVLQCRQAYACRDCLGAACIQVQQRSLQLVAMDQQGLQHPLLDAGRGHSRHSCLCTVAVFQQHVVVLYR